MAPFVGLGSTILVPSLLKALPALKASTISDSRMDIIAELCGWWAVTRPTRGTRQWLMCSKSASRHLINCYNAIWRLLNWGKSELGRTFTAGRRWRPWTGQRYNEKGTSYQVSLLNLLNVWFGVYLLDQGNLGFTRGSQGYAYTTNSSTYHGLKMISGFCNV